MQTTLNSSLRRLALAVILSLPTLPAQAELPSVDVLVNFTGSQAGGGNGSIPPGTLTEAADGWLYGRTIFGGGTEANLQTTSPSGGGLQGGRVSTFYRIRNNGTGFEILARDPAILPASTWGWLAASDGYLYAPSSSNAGTLLRYLPGGTDWEGFGPTGTRATAVAETGGRFIFSTASSSAMRALSADGTTVTPLVTGNSAGGNNPLQIKVNSDGTTFIYFSGGGGAGCGSLERLSADGSTLQKLVSFSGATVGCYSNNPARALVLAGDYVYGATRQGELGGGVLWRVHKDALPGVGATSVRDPDCIAAGTPVRQCPFVVTDPGRPEAVEILHSFSTGNVLGGSNPDNLILGQDGNVYGISDGGATLDGDPASGTIWRYRIAREAGAEDVLEVLHTFSAELPDPARNNKYWVNGAELTSALNTGANAGGHTVGALMQASNGHFYGLATRGGSYGWGALFRFNPGDEVPLGATLTAAPPQVVFGINSLNASSNHYRMALGHYWIGLNWQAVYASDCVASSNDPDSTWTGPQPLSGGRTQAQPAHRIDATKLGIWTYTLTCQPNSSEFTEPVSATVTFEVVPVVADPKDVGNGGGTFSFGLLLGLLGLGIWRFRHSA